MKINANLTLTVSDIGVRIRIEDSEASIVFFDGSMDAESFCACLGRLSNVVFNDAVVMGLDKIGKRMEWEKFSFEMPKGVGWKDRTKVAEQIALEKCPEGFTPELYFGSQDSFFEKDGVPFARCTIRRWV